MQEKGLGLPAYCAIFGINFYCLTKETCCCRAVD